MILIGYDGSEDARAAIDHAGQLLPGCSATVLTVWEPFVELLARSAYGLGAPAGLGDIEAIDEANRQAAQTTAEEGAARARAAGLEGHAKIATRVSTVAAAILHEAEDLHAAAIVVGSRGLTGVKSVLLGSVSHSLIQHADRTVIVVPSAAVASARASRN